MTCSACAKRRKKWLERKAELKAQRKLAQAAAIGAAVAVSSVVGKVVGLSGEESEDVHSGTEAVAELDAPVEQGERGGPAGS